MFTVYKRKAVLITGGTKGIGLATGLAFARQGAQLYLTHRWGSADEEQIKKQFVEQGSLEPIIVEADVSRDEDTDALLEEVKQKQDAIEVFVSNACVVQVVEGIDSYSQRALFKSLAYSAWPMVEYLIKIKKVFGKYPRYLIGLSSDGPDHFYQGYEYVAISKAIMETFCRYLSKRLLSEDIRINMVRTRNVITESALAVHGGNYPEFVNKFGGKSHFITCEEVANTILALCSGLMDAFAGQVISVDKGGPFADNLFRLYRHREEWGL